MVWPRRSAANEMEVGCYVARPSPSSSCSPLAGGVLAQSNRIDTVTPTAPELASYGKYSIGVRTMQATDRNRPDILEHEGGRADGALRSDADAGGLVSRRARRGPETRRRIPRDHARSAITATLHGQAVRDAAPLASRRHFRSSSSRTAIRAIAT